MSVQRVRFVDRILAVLALVVVSLVATAPLLAESAAKTAPAFFSGLEYRSIGPFRGGRSAAVTGIPGQPLNYFMGATGGGLWQTLDGGSSWKNISDGFFGGSIGAVAVSDWDPNVIYVGRRGQRPRQCLPR